MKLRFALAPDAFDRVRDRLDAVAAEPAVGRRLSDVYLDTAEDDLASRGVALRFRRSAVLGAPAPGRSWRKQWLFPKGGTGPSGPKALGIVGLKRRLDATFSVHIERLTWRPLPWLRVSLDRIVVRTGAAESESEELRLDCRKRCRDAALRYAVELGAATRATRRPRDTGTALLAARAFGDDTRG